MQYRDFTLSKGQKAIFTTGFSNDDIVMFGICIKCGSKDENEENNGINHLLEHLLNRHFKKGLENSPVLLINAKTTREYVLIYFKVFKESFSETVRKIGNLWNTFNFNADDLYIEKKIINQEISEKQNPSVLLFENMMFDNFLDSSFRYGPTGKVASIRDLNHEKIQQLLKSKYVSSNIFFIVSGNVDIDETKDIIDKQYRLNESDFTTRQEHEITEKSIRNSNIKTTNDSSDDNVHVLMGLIYKRNNFDDRVRLTLMTGYLHNNRHSIIGSAIREERGLVYKVNCYPKFYCEFDSLYVYYVSKPKNYDLVNDTILNVFNDLEKKGVIGNNFDYIKMATINSLKMAYIDLEIMFYIALENEILFNKVLPIDAIVSTIESITKNDMNLFIHKILSKNRFNIKYMIDKR